MRQVESGKSVVDSLEEDHTPLSLARPWTVFLMVSVGMMSELSPVR